LILFEGDLPCYANESQEDERKGQE
jgi:hypothetical protein